MKIIVAGAGAVGSHLAKMLSQENHDIVLIDPDEDKLRQVGSTLDVMTRTGSATSITDLLDCGVKKADLFISVARKEETNITASILSKRLGAKKTIARIDNQEYLYVKHREHFTSMGIDYMIYPEKIASREIVGLLHQTGSTDIWKTIPNFPAKAYRKYRHRMKKTNSGPLLSLVTGIRLFPAEILS